MRREVLPGLDSLTKREGNLRVKMPDGWKSVVTVRPAQGEPARTGPPRDVLPGARRFTGRARAILTTSAVAAILVNAGAAWTYWRVTEMDTRRGGNGVAVEMTLAARTDPNVPLTPGGRGALLVTVINSNDFPIRITSVSPGPGRAVADDDHRDAGCEDPIVEPTRKQFPVRWDVQKNTLGAFTIPDALIRGPGGAAACDGAVFTIPIQASGAGQGF